MSNLKNPKYLQIPSNSFTNRAKPSDTAKDRLFPSRPGNLYDTAILNFPLILQTCK